MTALHRTRTGDYAGNRFAAVALLAVMVLIHSCQSPKNYDLPEGGVAATAGRIHVVDILVDSPHGVVAGGDAPLHLAISNDSTRPDALVGVSTPVARRVQLKRDGRAVRRLTLPPGRLTDLEHSAAVVLEDVRRPLPRGHWFPVTFEFARAGDVTVSVTVGPLGSHPAAINNPNPDNGGSS